MEFFNDNNAGFNIVMSDMLLAIKIIGRIHGFKLLAISPFGGSSFLGDKSTCSRCHSFLGHCWILMQPWCRNIHPLSCVWLHHRPPQSKSSLLAWRAWWCWLISLNIYSTAQRAWLCQLISSNFYSTCFWCHSCLGHCPILMQYWNRNDYLQSCGWLHHQPPQSIFCNIVDHHKPENGDP